MRREQINQLTIGDVVMFEYGNKTYCGQVIENNLNRGGPVLVRWSPTSDSWLTYRDLSLRSMDLVQNKRKQVVK
jgi:hypothetical protein